jgi:hypothetical protein
MPHVPTPTPAPAPAPAPALPQFFGEPLPARFHRRRAEDMGQADLLIVMGTSLVVQPFASMIGGPRAFLGGRQWWRCGDHVAAASCAPPAAGRAPDGITNAVTAAQATSGPRCRGC